MEKKYTSQEVEIILQNFGKDNGMSSNGIHIKRWWNTWETEHSANTSVVRSVCNDWVHKERIKMNNDKFCPICGEQLQQTDI